MNVLVLHSLILFNAELRPLCGAPSSSSAFFAGTDRIVSHLVNTFKEKRVISIHTYVPGTYKNGLIR